MRQVPELLFRAAKLADRTHGKVNWQNPFDNFDSYVTIYGMFVVAFLAATSVMGVGVGGAVPQPEENP
jgi:hypothetical protein